MKKTIILLLIGVTSSISFAQDKNARTTIDVDGVCEMCKNRIEKAALKTKGIKSAVWSVNTHELQLIYDQRKVSLDSIHSKIAAAGHDTVLVKASDEAYDNLHPCCKYREAEVLQDHDN